MPLRFRLRKPRPAFTPQPQPAPQTFMPRWTPQPLPVGEVPPTDTLAELSRLRRAQDVWAGTRDTDRRTA